jgi:hypothetical protein
MAVTTHNQIKGIKPQGKPWTQNERFITPPQADGVLKTIIKEENT